MRSARRTPAQRGAFGRRVSAPASADEFAPSPSAAKRQSSWLGGVAAVLAIVSLVVSLFGYGVLMGLGSVFQIDHNLFISSPFDLLLSAWVGVAMVALKVTRHAPLFTLYQQFAPAIGVVVLIALATALFALRSSPKDGRIARLSGSLRQYVRSKTATPQGQRRVVIMATSAVMALTTVLAPLLLSMLVYLSLALASTATWIGYSSARDYADQYVLPSTKCVAHVDSSEPEPVHAKPIEIACVAITRADAPDQDAKQGAIVLATSSYALLYHPETRMAERVPIQNTLIRSLSPVRRTAPTQTPKTAE